MDIKHHEGQNRGYFFIEEGGKKVGEIVYSKALEKTITIEHTEVDEEYRGKEYGYRLVQKTVQYARDNGLKILPVCKFAKAVFDKEVAFGDVLQ